MVLILSGGWSHPILGCQPRNIFIHVTLACRSPPTHLGILSLHMQLQLAFIFQTASSKYPKTSCLFHEVFRAIEAQSNKRPIGPNFSDCAPSAHGPRWPSPSTLLRSYRSTCNQAQSTVREYGASRALHYHFSRNTRHAPRTRRGNRRCVDLASFGLRTSFHTSCTERGCFWEPRLHALAVHRSWGNQEGSKGQDRSRCQGRSQIDCRFDQRPTLAKLLLAED